MVKRLVPFLLVLCASLLLAASAVASYGVRSFSMSAENEKGSPDVQAGSHPYQLTTSFMLNETPYPEELENDPKDIQVELPPGFFGDPQATPRCTYAEFSNPSVKCPPDTQVGTEDTFTTNRRAGEPHDFGNNVYNIEPSPGVAAEFGYYVFGGIARILLDASVRTGGDYGLTVNVPNIPEVLPVRREHGETLGSAVREQRHGLFAAAAVADEPNVVRGAAYRYDQNRLVGTSRRFASMGSPMPEIEGCGKLDFSPGSR